jgi:endogenous inhibitor of DNA gyrase (YacG/DUF329 family)
LGARQCFPGHGHANAPDAWGRDLTFICASWSYVRWRNFRSPRCREIDLIGWDADVVVSLKLSADVARREDCRAAVDHKRREVAGGAGTCGVAVPSGDSIL